MSCVSQASAGSGRSYGPGHSVPAMGKTLIDYLDVDTSIYRCASCRSHLARADAIESKLFQGSSGPAYLFNAVINVTKGPPEDRKLTTGDHTVRDIFCAFCDEYVGWFYDRAYEPSQRYKEGKWILERQRLSTEPFVSPALSAAAASAALLRALTAASIAAVGAAPLPGAAAAGSGAAAANSSAGSSAAGSAAHSVSASPAASAPTTPAFAAAHAPSASLSAAAGAAAAAAAAASAGASASSSVASSPALSPALAAASAGGGAAGASPARR